MTLLKALAFAYFLIICSLKSFSQNSPEKGKLIVNEVLYLNETQALGIGDNIIALMNNKGKFEWEYDIHQSIKGAGKFHGNVVVFYLKKGDLYASILDIKKGTVLNERVVYPKNNYKQVIVHNDPVGNFDHLLIRTIPGASDINGTKALKVVTISPDLEAVAKDLSSITIDNSFVGSSSAYKGHFYIVSITNNSLVVEHFNDDVLEHKIEKPLNCSKKIEFEGLVRTDTSAGNAVLVSLKYRNADKDDQFSYFNFNFDNKQVTFADEAPLNNKSPYEFKHKDDLVPEGIFFTKDKIIFVKEVRYLGLTTTTLQYTTRTPNFTESAVVTVYDKQMKLQQDIVLKKKSVMSSIFISRLGCHIKSDNLYITSHEGPQIGKHEDYCYTINVNTGKWDKKKMDSKESGESRYIYGPANLWFANEIILSYLSGSTLGSSGISLEKISYSDL